MRKPTILIALFLLILQAANAQNQKGDQTLGIGLGFTANSGNYSYQSLGPASLDIVTLSGTSFSTNPTYSYFIANNLDLGVSIGFGSETYNIFDSNANSATKQVDKNYTGSLYLRKYFLYKNKVGIRTGPYLSYQYFDSNFITSPTNGQSSNSSGNNYHAGITADFVYYPSSKIGLAVNLGNLSYNYGKTSSQQQSSSASGVNLQFLNNNLMLTAFYVFGK